MTAMAADGKDITADFLDPNFRKAVREELGLKPDVPITETDVSAVTSLNVFGRSITRLAGIEHFGALQELDCSYNRLMSLDVRGLAKLKRLRCNDNYLTSLNVSNLEALSFLECSSNMLSALGVSSLTNLKTLLCGGNWIGTLNVSGLLMLETLECRDNNLTGLYLGDRNSISYELKYLNCRNNLLSGAWSWPSVSDMPGARSITMPNLESLNFGGNRLTSLNVSNCPKLKELCCCHNQLTFVDFNTGTNFELLYVCVKSNMLSRQDNIHTVYYDFIDFSYNHYDESAARTLGLWLRQARARSIKAGPQNSDGLPYVVRIADYPKMAVADRELELTGQVLGMTNVSINWSIVEWSEDEATKPTLRTTGSGLSQRTYLSAQTPGTAIVEARVADGRIPGDDYVQYIRIAVVEPLAFTGSSEFDVPASKGQITPVYVGSGVTGGRPPFNFSASGLPLTLSLSTDGVITGTLPEETGAGMADITVTDAHGITAMITIGYGALNRNYTIGGRYPDDGNWYESLDALLGTLGNAWRDISKADITLLGNVMGSTMLDVLSGQNITMNLNGFNLTIQNTSTAVDIHQGAKLNVNGAGNILFSGGSGLSTSGGELNNLGNANIRVIGGLYAVNSAKVKVNSVEIQSGTSSGKLCGIYAGGGSEIGVAGGVTVVGGIGSNCTGIEASGNSIISVGGSVSVRVRNSPVGVGVSADSGATVTVLGGVTSGVGVYSDNNRANVYIHGEIDAGEYIRVMYMGSPRTIRKMPYPGQETIGGVSFYKYSYGGGTASTVYVKVGPGVPDFLYGDVNNDGFVDIGDFFDLRRHLAGWPEYSASMINIDAADVMVNGDVDLEDLYTLRRHVAGWPDFRVLPIYQESQQIAGASVSPFSQQVAVVNMPISSQPLLRIGDAAGRTGETVKVPISIAQNPGITGIVFTISYDESALKLIGYEDKGLIAGAAHTPGSVVASGIFAWINDLAINNNTNNGVLVILDFEILKEAAPGDIAIELTYKPKNILNAEMKSVYFDTAPGKVSVTAAPTPTPADRELLGAAANFISITETSKNSGVWALSFNVTETWSDNENAVVPYVIEIKANNANIKGSYDLGKYTLIYDIAGNGSNIKEFRVTLYGGEKE